MRVAIAVIGAGVCLGLATPALSYVQTTAPGSRQPARWERAQVRLEWAPSDLSKGLAAEEVREALKIASEAWSSAKVRCTSARIEIVERARPLSGGTQDGVSSLVFHERRFCKRGVQRPGYCYDPRMAAMTTLQFDDSKRIIVEADVELNAVTFDFSSKAAASCRVNPKGGGPRYPLALVDVLMHEFGHVLGFSHVCTRGYEGRRDDRGREVPRCDRAPARLRQSLMAGIVEDAFDIAGGRARHPRKVGALERESLCAVYPR